MSFGDVNLHLSIADSVPDLGELFIIVQLRKVFEFVSRFL